MNSKEKTLWITNTAAMTALLLVLQSVTSVFGNTIVTGSAVNLVLIVSVMTCGILSGLSVALISPVAAKLIGIGPLWSLIPFIIAGNTALVSAWHLVGNRHIGNKYAAKIAALLIAAAVKFLVLYIGIVKLGIPLLLNLPHKQALVISNMFSLPQLLTALLGGIGALPVITAVKRAEAGKRDW